MSMFQIPEAILSAADRGDKAELVEKLTEFLRELPGRKTPTVPAPKRHSMMVEGRQVATTSIELMDAGEWAFRMHLKVWPKGTATVCIRRDGSRGIVNWKGLIK